MNKLLVCLEKKEDIEVLRKLGINNFLFALEKYSIGHTEFTLEEIPENTCNYLLINRILDCDEIIELEKLLKKLPSKIKGIIYEDLGILEITKDLDLELIWFQNHFGTNSESINFYLDYGNESAVISNELTKEEIEYILNNTSKPLIIPIFGYNQMMYSRRTLLKNYSDEYNLEYKTKETLTFEELELDVLENDHGTIILSDKIFNGTSLGYLPNVKYFFIDLTNIQNGIDIIKDILNNKKEFINTDDGFLNKKTVYKIKELD